MTLDLNRTFPSPAALADWEAARPLHRATLWRLLGDLPPCITPDAHTLSVERRDGCVVEKFAFDNGAGATVNGYFLLPERIDAPLPAIVYCHAHGGQHEIGKQEVFSDRFDLGFSPALALVAAGYAVLAPEAYAFGERQIPGSSGVESETSLAKQFLWEGRTLLGMILRDDLLALDYLLTRPEIDPARVGVTGMSLGGTRCTWLAALDDRPRVVIPVSQMNRWRAFAARGEYPRHAIYYYLPGALRADLDMEMLVALAAPRPQLILSGDQDPLSPIEGIHVIDGYARRVYALYGASAHFATTLYPGLDHCYTPEMFTTLLAHFQKFL